MEKFGVEVFEEMGAGDGSVDLLSHPSMAWHCLQRKYDGTRALVHKKGSVIVMPGRSWKTNYALNPLYADIVRELRALPVDECILDAELTFFDKDGVDRVRTANSTVEEARREGLAPRLMVFDLISVMGQSARNYPLGKRLEMLGALLNAKRDVRTGAVEVVETHMDSWMFREIYEKILAQDGEGVLIKRLDAPYIGGDEKAWLKVKKSFTEDCVIIGMTVGKGSRAGAFGSLILAQWSQGRLYYVGKAGTGLDGAKIARLYRILDALPKADRAEFAGDLPDYREVLKLVKPAMVAEVKFMNRTKDGILRMPVFMREREDKTPEMCKVSTTTQ